MKKIFALIAVIALALAPLAFATDETELTPNGVSQGTLVRYLANAQATVNELAADHDADNAAVAELIADHDADNNVIDDLKTLANGLRTYLNDGALAHGTLLITAAPEKFKTTTTAIYTISGVAYAKPATDNLVFSAADTINTASGAGDFWGIWLVQVNAAGTVSTKSPAANQVYATEAAAIAALPTADALNVAIGYITVEANNGADWVANTDDMTAASDCQAANFVNVTVKSVPAAVASSPAADLTANTQAADLSSDSVLGSGTVTDPKISLVD